MQSRTMQKFDWFRSRRLAVVEVEHATQPLTAVNASVVHSHTRTTSDQSALQSPEGTKVVRLKNLAEFLASELPFEILFDEGTATNVWFPAAGEIREGRRAEASTGAAIARTSS